MDYLFLYEGFDVIVFFNFLRLFKFEDVYVVIGKKGMYCFFIYKCIYMLFVYCLNFLIVKIYYNCFVIKIGIV